MNPISANAATVMMRAFQNEAQQRPQRAPRPGRRRGPWARARQQRPVLPG